MTQGQYGGMNPYESMNPPTSYEYQEEPPATTWPTVLGIIGIILSVLGILGSTCSVALPFLWTPYINWLRDQNAVPEDQLDAMAASMAPNWWLFLAGGVGLIFSIWLLMAAIGVLKRRRSGASSIFAWAMAYLVWAVIGMIGNILLTPAPPAAAGNPASAGIDPQAFQVIGQACGFIFAAAYPVFVIFWMLRSRIKQEVAMWP